MAPKKGTKAYKQEYILVHYGINPRTKSVDSVWQSRDGGLSKSMSDGTSAHHQVIGGRDAVSEISIVWGLTDLFSVPAAMVGDELTKQRVHDLQTKAAQTTS